MTAPQPGFCASRSPCADPPVSLNAQAQLQVLLENPLRGDGTYGAGQNTTDLTVSLYLLCLPI